MSKFDRRAFIRKSAGLLGGAMVVPAWARGAAAAATATQPADAGGATLADKPRLLRATDLVELGKTGVQVSRLSMGTGTMGGREQRELGIKGVVKLFRHGLDQGVRWWDTADMYKTHPHVAATLKEIKRDKITITSKTRSRDADGVRNDIERFRREMNTEYIDIVLLHCMQDPEWPEKMKGPMDVLSEAKEKGWVRAVGVSCHTFGALQAAADEPWVEVDLARINPYAVQMDVGKPEEVPKVDRVLKTMHERGKSVYGMKIMGEGRFQGDKIDESLRFALTRGYLSGFTIGFGGQDQVDDVIRRIERLGIKA